jgi:hypothetical protein
MEDTVEFRVSDRLRLRPCEGVKLNGRPCRARGRGESRFCVAHDPATEREAEKALARATDRTALPHQRDRQTHEGRHHAGHME